MIALPISTSFLSFHFLSFFFQELSECKRALAADEIDELGGGEEQNDLLDYLRALEPEQVKEGAGVGGWEDGGSGFGLG